MNVDTFYKKKRVLITGATGFIGKHLLDELLRIGADVAIISRSNPKNIDSCKVFVGHLEDKEFTSKSIRDFSPNIIFHLAASRERVLTYEAFSDAIDVDLKGTLNLFFSALELENLERLVILGTAEEYGDNVAPFTESMRESSVSAYSFAKQSVTQLSQLMHKSLHIPTVVIRPSIVYGPGQSNDMFLPALIQNLLQGKEFAMTAGEQTRDYVYVADLVEAILKSGFCSNIEGEIINIGSGKPIQIAQLVNKVEDLLQCKDLARLGAIPYRQAEQMNYWLDTSKAKNVLGWLSSTSLEDGLKKTITWYRNKVK